jgi:hypothetical protein
MHLYTNIYTCMQINTIIYIYIHTHRAGGVETTDVLKSDTGGDRVCTDMSPCIYK